MTAAAPNVPQSRGEEVLYSVDGATIFGTLSLTSDTLTISGESTLRLPLNEIRELHLFLDKLLILVRGNRRDVVIDATDMHSLARTIRRCMARADRDNTSLIRY